MKRAVIIAAILAGAAVTSALLLGGRPAAPDPDASPDPPPHAWLAQRTERLASIYCDFQSTRDRFEMTGLWREELWPCSLGQGWTTPDGGGIKALAHRPHFDFILPAADWTALVMSVKAFPRPEPGRPQTVTVRLNGQMLAPVEVPTTWTTVQVPVPAGILREGVNRAAFSFGYRIRESGGKDYRLFAMHLREFLVTRAPELPLDEESLSRLIEAARERPLAQGLSWNPADSGFEIRGPGTLALPIVLAENAERVELDVSYGGRRTAAPDLRISLHGQGSGSAAGTVGPGADGWFRRALRLAVGLPRMRRTIGVEAASLAGDACLLTVEVSSEGAGKIIRLSAPRVIHRNTPGAMTPDPGTAPASPASPPDIILITLDAARSDRLSCYGYERRTTPNIDRLAAESLLFREVFALAPYTLCSVPTMVTGLSFLDHGIVAHGDRLADGATTLAEHLKGAGYRTACFSATPNNSRALGTDQGYDEFVETWQVVPRPQSTDPFLLSRLAIEWLAASDEGAPLHLQLHYVPPHAPYSPRPEFDIFTDPSYRGRFDGSHTTINALDSGLWTPRPEDLAHVNALYDGNLRMGDAAVAQVLEALRRRPRWRDTVVLVTSDHGEGFLEHGRTSHNSTLYDEMLRVPFVLRLPEELRTTVDAGRLASLADIVPTLLATAGIRPDGPVDGINLLSPPTPADRGRVVIARTPGAPPLYALRTSHWKLLLAGSGQGLLFNLEEDPGERRDLALQSPLVFTGLGQLLTERLAQPPHFAPAAEEQELAPADIEMLEALGYVH